VSLLAACDRLSALALFFLLFAYCFVAGYKLSARGSGSRSIDAFSSISMKLWTRIRRWTLCSIALGWVRLLLVEWKIRACTLPE